MAGHVDRTHLSRTKPAAASTGTLYEPSGHSSKASVSGGWQGKRRTARRRMAAAGTLAGAAVVLWGRRRLARPAA